MPARANWSGHLSIGGITCPVKLYTVSSPADRISFSMISRRSLHQLKRAFVDEVTQEEVPADQQMKGYDDGERLVPLKQDEIEALKPEAVKTIHLDKFVSLDEINPIIMDKAYYLAPANNSFDDVFVAIRDGLRGEKVAAITSLVLFRRFRHVMIYPYKSGLMVMTLHINSMLVRADQVFSAIKAHKTDKEMMALAEHIIASKKAKFDPEKFVDEYEKALSALIKAKVEGRKLPKMRRAGKPKSQSLLEALRQSAKAA